MAESRRTVIQNSILLRAQVQAEMEVSMQKSVYVLTHPDCLFFEGLNGSRVVEAMFARRRETRQPARRRVGICMLLKPFGLEIKVEN